MTNGYPVRFSVEYPDRDLNRLTTFFRLFTAIPILFVLGSIAGYSSQVGEGAQSTTWWSAARGSCSSRPC